LTRGIKFILGALILVEITDGILTNILIRRGIAREGNPFLINIAGENGFMILKIVGVLLAVVILWDIHRRYPRLAFWTSSVFLLVYCGIVAWNTSLLILGG
jgi:hypothetical protein